MKINASIATLCLLLMEISALGKEVKLPFDLTMTVPDNLAQDTTTQCLFLAYDSVFSISVATVETSDFRPGRVLRTLEQYSYNLQAINAHCYKEETDRFYEWNKDYVKKYYQADGVSLISYTFYTADRPYSILIGYKGENGEKEAEAVIQSISYHGNVWKQVCLTFERAVPFWLLFYFLIYPAICLCVVFAIDKDGKEAGIKKPYVISVLCTIPILLVTLSGDWISIVCYLLINVVATIPCFLIGFTGVEDLLSKFKRIKGKKGNFFDGDGGGDDYNTEYSDITGL